MSHLDKNIAIIDKIAVKINLIDQSKLIVNGATKNNKFPKTKLIKNNKKLEFLFEINNAHKLTKKLYQTNIYGVQLDSVQIMNGFI